MTRLAITAALALAACGPAPEGAQPEGTNAGVSATQGSAETAVTPSPQTWPRSRRPTLIAERLVRAEWAKAENRAGCAPLAFRDDGGARGSARRATFSGGWGVAFDLPGKRSAYGLAGAGTIPDDAASEAEKRRKLSAQWPSFRDLPQLPQPAFAGYGIEGAQPYPDDDPQGLKAKSLAYVRVHGQSCQYNVWSGLGRSHLELLLESLRMVEGETG